MSLVSIDANEILFKQGSIGNFFFIVKSGSLALTIEDKFITKFSSGDSFGELALMHGDSRSGTVTSLEETYLWCLSSNNFRKIVDRVNKKNFEENRKIVEKIPILQLCDDETKNEICSKILKETYEKNDFIVRTGEVSNCVYMIHSGEVDVFMDKEQIRTLKAGDHFGEMGVLMNDKRSTDIIAQTKVVCYVISNETFTGLFGPAFRDVLYKNLIRGVFTAHNKLSKMNDNQVDDLFSKLEIVKFEKMSTVLPSGSEKNKKFIVVIEGSLFNYNKREVIAQRGQILFDQDIFSENKEKIGYDLQAYPDCLAAIIETELLIGILGGIESIHSMINESELLSLFKNVSIFRNLDKNSQKALGNALIEESYTKGKKIIEQNSTGRSIYIVKEGSIDIFVNYQYIRTLNSGEYFGERTLFFNEKRSATAQARGNVVVYKLNKTDFDSILDLNVKQIMKDRLSLQDEKVELKDLDVVATLGNGSFGRVFLVRNRKTKCDYALKAIAKGQIDEESLHENLQMERDIQLKIDHPLIVKLVKTLKDRNFIYFLMEHIQGTDLFTAIREIGLLNTYQTQFYGASLLLCVSYLHDRNIVYRDIKPENIMVGKNGYIKMIDFGTAKDVPSGRTTTIIGTPHYMAPEMVTGKGYSCVVDVWSVGSLLIRCLYVRIPLR